MSSNALSNRAVAVVLVCLAVGLAILGGRRHDTESLRDKKPPASRESSSWHPATPKRDPGLDVSRFRGGNSKSPLANAIAEYDALNRRFTGNQLEDERLQCIGRVTRKLSPVETCRFLDHVSGDLNEASLTMTATVIGGVLTSASTDLGTFEQIQQWVLGVESPLFKAELLANAGRYFGLRDTSDPRPFLAGIPTPSGKDQFLAGYFGRFQNGDDFPLNKLWEFSPREGSSPRLVEVIQKLPSNADFSDFRKILESKSGTPTSDVFTALIGKWSDVDTAGAARFCADAPESVKQSVDAVLQGMVESSHQSLPRLIDAIPPSPEKDEIVATMVRGAAHYSPEHAWRLGLQLQDPDARVRLLTEIYTTWAASDKAAATAAWEEAAKNP